MLILFLPGWLLALCVHEFAHAWVADKLGDPTPRTQGRLTLSPMSHIDILGSLVLPIAGILMGGFFFGWAKPVIVVPRNFTRKQSVWLSHLMVALAGPFSNLLLAAVAALGFALAARLGADPEGFALGATYWAVAANALLFVFNLIPIPPLDGARMWPESWSTVRDFLRRYGFFLFIILFFLPIFGGHSLGSVVIAPLIEWIKRSLLSMALHLFGGIG